MTMQQSLLLAGLATLAVFWVHGFLWGKSEMRDRVLSAYEFGYEEGLAACRE